MKPPPPPTPATPAEIEKNCAFFGGHLFVDGVCKYCGAIEVEAGKS